MSLHTVVNELRTLETSQSGPHSVRVVSWRKGCDWRILSNHLLKKKKKTNNLSLFSLFLLTALHLVNDWMVQTERHFCNLLSGLLKVFLVTLGSVCLLWRAEMRKKKSGGGMEEGSPPSSEPDVGKKFIIIYCCTLQAALGTLLGWMWFVSGGAWGDPWRSFEGEEALKTQCAIPTRYLRVDSLSAGR